MWNQGMFIVVIGLLLIRTVITNRKTLTSRGNRAAYIGIAGLTVFLLAAYAFGLKPLTFPGWLVEQTAPVFMKYTKR